MNNLGLAPSIEDSYRRRISADLPGLSGARFERFAYALIDRICAPAEMIHRGLNLEGAPVSKVVDSISADTHTAAQYSSESGYFSGNAQKPKDDYQKVRQRHPSANIVHLLSNDEAPINFTSFLEWTQHESRKDGLRIEPWDALRIADFLINNLHDERFTATIEEWLPCIGTFRSEYAFSQLLPRIRSDYIHRSEEIALREMVMQTPVTIVHGLSGTGKSDLCCAVAWDLKPEFETVAWLDARSLQKVEDLTSISLHRYGTAQSVLGFLERQKVLLVLDNVEAALTLDSLAPYLRNGSRVMITQQPSVPTGLAIYGISQAGARQMLETGNDPCPRELFDRIYQATGGHPLTLSLIKRLANRFGWTDIAAELPAVGDLVDPSTQEKLRQRVLGKVETLVPTELDFLRWCGSPEIDRSLARHVLGIGGISNLEDLNLLTRSTDDVLRFHDIVFSFVKTAPPDKVRADSFRKMLVTYLQRAALEKQAPFFACTHRHLALIYRSITEGDKSPALLYSVFVSNDPENLSQKYAGDLNEYTTSIVDAFPEVPMQLRCLTVIEAMECEYVRLLKEPEGAAKATRAFVQSTLGIFDQLLLKNLEPENRALIIHHKAKALNRSGKKKEAEELYRSVLASSTPLNQSRLQLARLLERRGEGAAGEQLIRDILENARSNPASVSTTIVLEVFGTLRHGHLRPFRDKLASEFADIAVMHIERTIATGFEQPYFALASLANFWSKHDAELFLRLFRELPPPPASLLRSDSGKAAVAEVYVHAAELLEASAPATADVLRAQVIDSLSRVGQSNSFYDHLEVRALIGRKKYSAALEILQASDSKDNVWHYVWEACAFDGMGRAAEADVSVAKAIELAKGKSIDLWMVETRCRKLFNIVDQ